MTYVDVGAARVECVGLDIEAKQDFTIRPIPN
jgi:hypothetical protein